MTGEESGSARDDRTVREVSGDRATEVVRVFCDAFVDYPVMRFVIGPCDDYDRRLDALIAFFVAARVWRHEPMLAIDRGDEMVAAAIMTPPGVREASPELAEHRERVWAMLGSAARSRYEALGTVWKAFAIDEPNLHLNMIGVRASEARQGLGRRLMDAVHGVSEATATSAGVTLTTEDPGNVAFYRRLGYEVIGHTRVTDDLETWGCFRRDGAPASR